MPEPEVGIIDPPPIEEININFDVEDDVIVKNESDEIEFAEVKVEHASDEFVETVDCDMGVFAAMYEIKIEEPLELTDIIDNDPSTSHSNDLAIGPIKEEFYQSESIEELLIESNSIENGKPKVPPEEATPSRRRRCRDRDNSNNAEPSPYECSLCEKAYSRSDHLWRHYEQQHGNVPDPAMTNMRRQNIDVEIVAESNASDLKSIHGSEPIPQNTEAKSAGVSPDEMAQLMYCHLCDRKYANHALCATHMLDVHQIKLQEVHRPFKCCLCDKSYTKSGHLGRHYEKTHKDVSRNVKIKVRTDPMQGATSVTKIIPQFNAMPSDSIADLENVVLEPKTETPAEAVTPLAHCTICDRDYKTKSNWVVHMWGVHKIKMTPGRPHKCVILTCRKSHKSRMALTRHYHKEHGGNPERKAKTKEKGKRSAASAENGSDSEPSKVELMEAISAKPRSRCLLCDKRYANHTSCATHMLNVHNITMPDIERPYRCDKCRKAYVKLGHLQRHHKLAHGIGAKCDQKATTFECFACHETFNLGHMLKKHMSKMHLPVEHSSICPTCGISTQRLARHIASVHEIKEVQCHICHQIYSHPSRLTNHMRIHTLPVTCDLCPKRFPNIGSMRQHRRYHTQEKPFACKYCGTRFIERSTCTQHERVHTGEKP